MTNKQFCNYRTIAAAMLGILSSLFFATSALGQTPVSGTISQNRTWTTSGSPYVVTGNVEVKGASEPTLTIEPGVEVRFDSGARLEIGGNSLEPGALVQKVGKLLGK